MSRMNRQVEMNDIVAAYHFILGREPDTDGLSTFSDHASEGMTISQLRCHLMSSAEFTAQNVHTTPQEIFRIVHERRPTDKENLHLKNFIEEVGAVSNIDILRAAVMAFSRTDYPTPVNVRFTANSVKETPVSYSNSVLCLDKYDFSVSSTIIRTSDYEPHLRRFIEKAVKPGMTCVDIGANVGFHTMVMAKLVGNSGEVYAFEPNSENCRMIMLTLEKNEIHNVLLIPVALSNKLGAIAFSPAIGSNGGFMHHVANGVLHPNCSIVPTVRMDAVLSPNRLDFIKIDVEGAEPLALEGAKILLQKFKPIIVSEYSVDMIEGVSKQTGRQFLRGIMDLGYRAFTLGNSGPAMQIEDLDVFIESWTNRFRIEDIAFIPHHSDVSPDL